MAKSAGASIGAGALGHELSLHLTVLTLLHPIKPAKPLRGYYWGNAVLATPHPHFALDWTLACSWPCFATKHRCNLSPTRTFDYDLGANVT